MARFSITVVLATLFASFALAIPTWSDWGHGGGRWGRGGPGGPRLCNSDTWQVRRDFDSLSPAERKDFTDAINCLRTKPSELDQTLYPAAINRFFDWAVVHVNRTSVAHLNGYFLTWHRMYIHLFEQDLRRQCGYKGAIPYWNWPKTAQNLTAFPIFSGDEYSMSGDGVYIDSGPIALGPGFALPKGSGGGCIKSGPFQGMSYTMRAIPIQGLITGSPLPPTAFDKNETCLTRDLNSFVAQTYLNWTQVAQAIAAPDLKTFDTLLNGVFGGGALGLHSGAHFSIGNPASSIFVSPQDPIWYPLHVMLDNIYVQWQAAHPDIYDQLDGTETANNAPPSANVTLESYEPDWGYFHPSVQVKDLISTTAGPFCYIYEWELESA